MRPRTVAFSVLGQPAAQGSKRHVGNGQMVESSTKVRPWREAVKAAVPEDTELFAGPVKVNVIFRFVRPASHYGTGRNAEVLKPTAPRYPTARNVGDIDKLLRATLDALTDTLLVDDSLVVESGIAKVYATRGAVVPAWRMAGAVITVTEMEN